MNLQDAGISGKFVNGRAMAGVDSLVTIASLSSIPWNSFKSAHLMCVILKDLQAEWKQNRQTPSAEQTGP
jgi:hypothetical protein